MEKLQKKKVEFENRAIRRGESKSRKRIAAGKSCH